jgi:hypothetical protein
VFRVSTYLATDNANRLQELPWRIIVRHIANLVRLVAIGIAGNQHVTSKIISCANVENEEEDQKEIII